MFRTLSFALLFAAVAMTSLNAGQIQIGGAAGLTASYVGAQPANAAERDYLGTLFVGDTENGVAPAYPSGSLTDPNNGVTFAIMNDSGSNYWAIKSTNDVPVTMTIPVGIFDVTTVWTMLNDYWGTSGASNTKVVLNFGASAGVSDGSTQVFNLINGVQIRDATDCTGVSTSPAPGANPTSFPAPCKNYATTAPGASQAFTTAYNGNTLAGGQASNTSGNLVLDDQSFLVNPAFFGKYLVNIQISNSNGATNGSRTALSAITVATPEPASVAMFLGGFVAMMLIYSRRRGAADTTRI